MRWDWREVIKVCAKACGQERRCPVRGIKRDLHRDDVTVRGEWEEKKLEQSPGQGHVKPNTLCGHWMVP